MEEFSTKIEYNQDLKALEKLLSGVARPGEYYARGSLTVPMPKLEIEGVGVISFPVHPAQVSEIVAHAALAPYGRGEETIVDPNIRRVWQVETDRFRVGGTAWPETLASIVARCAEVLGCDPKKVSAEPYKLLLYEPGGFFRSHRDTEKTEGMFATLVVVLPSSHSGGELVIRHAGREAVVDFGTTDVSEISYAAFYADCQHEVRPITKGNRLCLVYNLVQKAKRGNAFLTAPENSVAIKKAGEILTESLQDSESPRKIVYLLEHEYTPEGLSFAGLKNHDRALGAVLAGAAEEAGCVIHLGIVHIEETGPAEVEYVPRSRRRWSHHDEEGDVDEHSDYSVVEISESLQYISNWITPLDAKAPLPEIPLAERELVPAGALDKEPPDQDRVMEATGNEGATFERSYHRAALVLWRQDRYCEVLLQSSVDAAMKYFKQLVRVAKGSTDVVREIAVRIVERWAAGPQGFRSYQLNPEEKANRTEMLDLLRKIDAADLAAEFIGSAILNEYDKSDNAALVRCSGFIPETKFKRLLEELVEKHVSLQSVACIDLFSAFARAKAGRNETNVIAETLCQTLVKACGAIEKQDENRYYWNRPKPDHLDAAELSKLITSVERMGEDHLLALAKAIIANPKGLPADEMVAPALINVMSSESARDSRALTSLWKCATKFLLQESEHPPVKPKDWARPVKLKCDCACCRDLEHFALDSQKQVHIFKVREALRNHIESTISQNGLDISCRTEQKGSPKPLTCTKNLATYERQCARHRNHIDSMKGLLLLADQSDSESLAFAARMKSAIGRLPE